MRNQFESEKIKRVALYIRVSTDEQVEKFGIPMQKETLFNLIRAKGKLHDGSDSYVYAGGVNKEGKPIDDNYIYIDEGESGTLPKEERPAFRKMMSDLEYLEGDNKPFDVVAVYKIDRFARRLRVLLDIIEYFEEKDVEFMSAHESIDTSNPFGKAVLGIMGVIAELELENIMQRTKEGKDSAQMGGVFMGTHTPYGYTKDKDKRLVELKEESQYLKQIFDKYLWEDMSLQAIASWLSENEVPSPSKSATLYGKHKGTKRKINEDWFWNPTTIKRFLTDRVYTGHYYFKRKVEGKETEVEATYRHKSLIDLATFQLVQEKMLKDDITRKNVGKKSERVNLLRGLLRCASCYNPEIDDYPHNLTGERKKIKEGHYSYYYKCKRKNPKYSTIHCNTLPLPAEQIEEYVLEILKKVIKNPHDVYEHQMKLASRRLEKEVLERKLESLRLLINTHDKTLENLRYQHKHGYISDLQLKKDTDKEKKTHEKNLLVRSELETALAEITIAKGYDKVFEVFKEKYEKALDKIYKDRDELQNILSLVIHDIIVFSRPIEEGDVVAGRRKKDQLMPYKLHIRFRFPREIMRDMARNFGVDKHEWWAI